MMTLEESSKIFDLRQRMLDNVANNRDMSFGISEDDYRTALSAIRRKREVAAAAGAAKKTKKALAIKPIDDAAHNAFFGGKLGKPS